MLPEHIELLQAPGRPDVHPEGTWAVVSVTRPSFAADSYVGQLWRLDVSGATDPRRITRGFRDTEPRISPDGRLIAFLRAGRDTPPQIHVVAADGGEPAQVTDARLGVSGFSWSPDSRMLAFCAHVAEPGRYGTTDDIDPAHEDARHITTNQFQHNGEGWTNDKRSRLFVVEVPDPAGEPPVTPVGRAKSEDTPFTGVPAATELTDGSQDASDPVFTPDGASILVTLSGGVALDDTLRTEVHRVGVDGGAAEPFLADPVIGFSAARFSNDHTVVFALGLDTGASGVDFVAKSAALYAAPASGGPALRLTDPAVLDLVGPPVPTGDDASLIIANTRGTSDLLRISSAGAAVTVSTGRPTVVAAAPIPGTDAVVATIADVDSPGEVARIEGGRAHRLTALADALSSVTTVIEPVEVEATAPDGYPVHGWAIVPEGEGPHPVLLSIHGGPYAEYPSTFFDEFQVWAEAGYAVVACNPRGSAGYGAAHGAAIKDDFGNLDQLDVLAFLDHATATIPGLDAERVGILGGSYGGYLTAWIIAHDHRFAAAIVERGYLDPASFIGSSDIGWFFAPAYNGATVAEQNRQSPTLLASQVQTPTFVVHSEKDLRCPLAQALRYYADLRAAGVETELLVFPGETHELSRSGTPWHRRQRFDEMLAWWARHLPTGRTTGERE